MESPFVKAKAKRDPLSPRRRREEKVEGIVKDRERGGGGGRKMKRKKKEKRTKRKATSRDWGKADPSPRHSARAAVRGTGA